MLLAIVLALPPAAGLPGWVHALNPIYFHLFLVGWATQMIFAVIYWMFPIVTREQPRGNPRLGWLAFGGLNAGLLLRVVAEPLVAVEPGGVFGWLLPLSAALQWVSIVGLVVLSWPRIRDRYRGE